MLTGTVQLTASLLTAHATVLRAVAGATTDEAERIMAVSKETYCPVDTGILKSSGIVLPAVVAPSGVEVTLGYGGNATEYARVVHEDLSAHHTVGQAKYLETPFNQATPGAAGRIAAGAQARLG